MNATQLVCLVLLFDRNHATLAWLRWKGRDRCCQVCGTYQGDLERPTRGGWCEPCIARARWSDALYQRALPTCCGVCASKRIRLVPWRQEARS